MKPTPLSAESAREMHAAPVKVVVEVPTHMPGNVIEYQPVEFEIHQLENHFRAVPQCSEAAKRLVNIPDAINFEFVRGRIVTYCKRAEMEDIAHDIIKAMSSRKLLRLR